MVKTETVKRGTLRRIVPRIVKATLWGTITFLMFYLPYKLFIMPMIMFPVAPELFSETVFYVFLITMVFFAFTTKLFSGTIFQHALGIARALILIIYFIYVFRGGSITLAPSIGDITLKITLDLSVFLAMFVLISLLSLGKSLLQAIDFLAREREPLPI